MNVPKICVADKVNLKVEIFPISGRFEITEDAAIVASGEISQIVMDRNLTPGWVNEPKQGTDTEDDERRLDADDVYKELRIRGYDYGPSFRQVVSMNFTGIHCFC